MIRHSHHPPIQHPTSSKWCLQSAQAGKKSSAKFESIISTKNLKIPKQQQLQQIH